MLRHSSSQYHAEDTNGQVKHVSPKLKKKKRLTYSSLQDYNHKILKGRTCRRLEATWAQSLIMLPGERTLVWESEWTETGRWTSGMSKEEVQFCLISFFLSSAQLRFVGDREAGSLTVQKASPARPWQGFQFTFTSAESIKSVSWNNKKHEHDNHLVISRLVTCACGKR